MTSHVRSHEHALAAGAGTAGLLTALVPADRYQPVTLLDRDVFLSAMVYRSRRTFMCRSARVWSRRKR